LSIDVSIENIPQSVLDEAGRRLLDYLVPIFVLTPQNPEAHLRLIGSGTLVEIKGTHYVLTAAHVWHQTMDAEQIGLVLTAHLSRFAMRRDAISARELWNRENPEWGPDLALLELGRPFVSTIAAYKSFVNLPRQRGTVAVPALEADKKFWAITGMVGQFSEVHNYPDRQIIEANVEGRAFFSGILETYQRNGHDYLDAGAKLELPGVPASFGGVSGGGLWEIGLSMTRSGKISWDEKLHLRGVAFWQSAVNDGRRIIRCHGPRSVYETAWKMWALPCGA
jgi:hypothetical protein